MHVRDENHAAANKAGLERHDIQVGIRVRVGVVVSVVHLLDASKVNISQS